MENKIAKAYEGLLVQNNEKQKFFGKLAGNALRCGIPLPMRLPKLSLWAKMCGNSFDTKAAVAETLRRSLKKPSHETAEKAASAAKFRPPVTS